MFFSVSIAEIKINVQPGKNVPGCNLALNQISRNSGRINLWHIISLYLTGQFSKLSDHQVDIVTNE